MCACKRCVCIYIQPTPYACVQAGRPKTKYKAQAFLVGHYPTSLAQIAHADNGEEGSFSACGPHVDLPMNLLMSCSSQCGSYLDIRPLQHETGRLRVHIPPGYCLVFRGDVVHRGVEGMKSLNVRLFVHLLPEYWRHADRCGANVTYPAAVDFAEHIAC